MKNKLEDKTTYSINSDFKMECPLCEEMIPVGYAKPIGLVQLQGKKKCRVTCKRKPIYHVGRKKTHTMQPVLLLLPRSAQKTIAFLLLLLSPTDVNMTIPTPMTS